MDTHTDSGLVTVASPHAFDETMTKLQALLREKGLAIFAIVDHSGEAAKVGLAMPPTQLVIFGSPRAGTPLMLASPDIAIDLPLKILVREGADGRVQVVWNAPAYLQARHRLPDDLAGPLAAVQALVTAVVR
jgi:uncharacterized protein (DUF302 family)